MSDFHLGYSDDALVQAREALAKGVAEADIVILAGDLFDHRVPKQEVLHEAIELFGALKAEAQRKGRLKGLRAWAVDEKGERREIPLEAPFLAIYGTHERRSKGLVNAVQMLAAAGLVHNLHARRLLVEKDGELVAFQGMGGLPEEFARQALKLLDPKPVPGAFNVFVIHQTLKELIPFNEEFLSVPDLPAGFDLYVNGHIHWNRELREGGRHVLLPGSTVITQMKPNEQHGKGYYLYDTAGKSAEFKHINARPFHYLELKFEHATPARVEKETRARLEEALAKERRGKPLVKLKLLGTLAKGFTPASVDSAALEKEYLPRAFVSVDKEFEAEELKQKVELLRRLREERLSSKEMGLKLLREKLDAMKSPLAPRAEELFEALAAGDVDAALARLDEKA
jgi:DNA repair exonuclease SbcCD nuclease subunit